MSLDKRKVLSKLSAGRGHIRVQVSWPRLQMSLIVALTAGVGFLLSVALRALGMPQMWLRYAICVVFAYAFFLLVLAIWRRSRHWEWPDFTGGSSGESAASRNSDWSGEGGNSGGAGASASFDLADSEAPLPLTETSADAPDIVSLDLDEGVWLIPLVLLVGGVALAALWLVWIAPTLLAEIALDAAMSAGLYRRLKRAEDGDWLFATLRLTWMPFLLALLAAACLGLFAGWLVPHAETVGDVIRHAR